MDGTKVRVIVERRGRVYAHSAYISSVLETVYEDYLPPLMSEFEYQMARASREIRRAVEHEEKPERVTNPFAWS